MLHSLILVGLLSAQTPFLDASATADRLQAALPAVKDAEERGTTALAWVRAMRRALGEIPLTADRDRQPYTGWLKRHEADLVYSEPAGQWLVAPDLLWKIHDGIRASASAEPFAWEIVGNGLPGECEGYPPCYLSGFTSLHGRYLQEHPGGEHAEQAVEEILESLAQIERLLNEPNGHELFDPKTGCGDLGTAAAALTAQLKAVQGRANPLIAAVGRLRGRCR
jgi:hypothetical protein